MIFCEYETQNDWRTINITVINKRTKKLISNTIKFNSIGNCIEDFVKIGVEDPLKTIKTNEMETFIVKSSFPINSAILFQVVRGKVINATEIIFPNPVTEKILDIPITSEMLPQVTFGIYIKTSKNYILSDWYTVKIKGNLDNDITLDVHNTTIDVDQMVDIDIRTKEGSTVFLLGSDIANLMTDIDNDIQEDRLMRNLMINYKNIDALNAFNASGLIYFTDSNEECLPNSELFTVKMPTIRKDTNSNDQDMKTFIRKNLKETWIFGEISGK